ncbi:MAG: YabP/YqfC family sporulation protein [Candidatus Fournierella pullistercoris]|uniref:YabP/YqfC family sporulation protein n=1 Tax=Candidatus Allofournierella pullistercoris TaxID=2838597 RepID=A0A948WT77_9FIRM|nr:YabP/YqfC family sporulation protein [Candidatus Fournierella pullistercoris]
MKKAKKTSSEPLKQTIADLFGQPPQEFYRQPVLHINCKGKLEIENCRQILQYDAQCIQLDMKQWNVKIEGDGLQLKTITRQRLLLEGKVFQVVLSYEQNQQKKEGKG